MGALVAIVNRRDRFHSQLTDLLKDYDGRFLTTFSPKETPSAPNWVTTSSSSRCAGVARGIPGRSRVVAGIVEPVTKFPAIQRTQAMIVDAPVPARRAAA